MVKTGTPLTRLALVFYRGATGDGMALVDLSKWDFAVEFRLYEAAALIVGIDPAEIYTSTKPARDNPRLYEYHEHPQIKPVVDRMEYDFLTACDLYEAMRDGKWKHSTDEPLSELLLRNREMEVVPVKIGSWGLPLDSVTQRALDTWHGSDDIAMYETAKFTRKELSRWLSAIGLKSVYQFDQGPPATIETPFGHWPWDNHHTELLGHLEAAARRYWQRYDPTDATTAPINKDVAEWLMTERKLSQKMAESIASMLRPDGLPTGPRK